MSMTGIGGPLMTGNSSCVGFFKMQNTAQGVYESRSLGRVLHFFMDSVWRGRGAALFRLLCVPAFYLGHKFP